MRLYFLLNLIWMSFLFVSTLKSDFLINSSNCKIPNLPVFSPELNLTRLPAIACSDFDPLLTFTTVTNNTARIHINQYSVEKYFKTTYSIRCCYSNVYRKGSEDYPDVGVVLSECKEFRDSAEILHNLIWVTCSESDKFELTVHGFPIVPIYENVHQVITVSESIRRKSKIQKQTTKKPISVLMIVIDSVSRLNFQRTMPLTKKFIIENEFYEFKGYNKVADNTYPNAMAFLTGLNYRDSLNTCKPTEITGLNNCPFIWTNYSNAGYTTAYGEDWSQIATFNYLKKGFKDSPTDYYFKPYMDAITYLRTKWQDSMPFCSGPENQGDRILNVASDFASSLRTLPSFGIFWMNTFSHNYITTPMTMDESVMLFFQKLKDLKVMEESIVILLSDHGIRYGEINNTTRGFFEVRLPMNYISLPKWFKNEYPREVRNFEENTEILTSNYDLYMTLQHILKFSVANYSITSARGCPNCRSLFEKIPDYRDCSSAGIPKRWCTCNENFTFE
ncbi:hypothetical protein ABEB36_008961 [Hypothenemus hampei]|uniref:Uncharacterized protein n=1 Tax=Hypothenemus hampei TaxID=57062 RepID=A0ABD1ENM6_HYPHA